VGRQVIVVANLAPRAMRGVESQGMLLAGTSEDRTSVVVISPEKALPIGSKVS
jgi:methionyl-tRNA synthetase